MKSRVHHPYFDTASLSTSAFNFGVMAIILDVTLISISGRKVSLESGLQKRARRALGVGMGRLLNALGRVLDAEATLEPARLQMGNV